VAGFSIDQETLDETIAATMQALLPSSDSGRKPGLFHFYILISATALFIPIMLLLDGPGWLRQSLLGIATALLLTLILRWGGVATRPVITAIVIATTGEIVLSLGWGLYTYRNALIPLYVPVGHGVFYAVAALTAMQRPLLPYARAIRIAAVVSGSAIAVTTLVTQNDTWGMIWWVIAVAFIARSRDPLLLASCCIYTMLLEYAGTAIGNWQWTAVVPGIRLEAANPPSGVGVLYVILDALTIWVVSLSVRKAAERTTQPEPSGEEWATSAG
jgi:hypothetical protein